VLYSVFVFVYATGYFKRSCFYFTKFLWFHRIMVALSPSTYKSKIKNSQSFPVHYSFNCLCPELIFLRRF
jgi:hypothetical protein